MHPRAVLGVVCATAVLAAGCGRSSTVSLKTETTGTITWNPCGTVQCATLPVPLDYKRPDAAHIDLALARLPASHQPAVGVLFTNPGGPGASGVAFLRAARQVFEPAILEKFDLVSWDPRGVGKSAPVDCGANLDAFYAVDREPKDASQVTENVDASKSFIAACKAHSAQELPFLATSESARDMDTIRAAIGVPQISYFGFSYGTFLGTVYANMFPKNVRAMTLDGAVDPARPYDKTVIDQARGFEDLLDQFFAWCRSSSDCHFARGADPRAAYDSLQNDVAQESLPATVDGEHRTLGPGEFDIGIVSALYSGASGFSGLADALAQAARGQGDKVLELSDQYTERSKGGRYSNETAALYATSCLDGPAPRNVAAVQQLAADAARVAPHFGATTVWLGLPCTFWPAPPTGKIGPMPAAGAPPILVLGTKGDPATPYEWAQALASELQNGRLLTFRGTGHTGYGKGSACVDDTVDEYMVSMTVPAEGTACAQ
jgi:pimeloyl-ACP methyl ester carboxylesterase